MPASYLKWRRFLLRIFLGLLLLPYLLVPVYALVPPISSHMIGVGLSGQGMERDWVSLPHISRHLVRAVLASEDSRFCDHYGIDFQAIDAALEKAERTGRAPHGASTISAQTAKNLFLWNGRAWIRKVLEAPLTLWLDAVLSKRRILEIYLNIAEWGSGLFGAEAAAQHYFHKPAAALSAHEAALLASALPAPLRLNAARPGSYLQRHAAIIQGRMGRAPQIATCIGNGF